MVLVVNNEILEPLFMFLQTIYTDFNRSSNTEFHYSDPETYNLKHNQKRRFLLNIGAWHGIVQIIGVFDLNIGATFLFNNAFYSNLYS